MRWLFFVLKVVLGMQAVSMGNGQLFVLHTHLLRGVLIEAKVTVEVDPGSVVAYDRL